jgi:hypothetical protein
MGIISCARSRSCWQTEMRVVKWRWNGGVPWRIQSTVDFCPAAIAVSAHARGFTGFFDDGQRGANLASFGRGAAHGAHFPGWHIVFVAAALPRAVGLMFGSLHDTVCCVLL